MDWLPDSPTVPAAAALAAVVLLLIGRRGRRINDHPVCRRCGFDLVGRPADSSACSECGADLRRRGAVRDGARRCLRGAITAGLWILFPSLIVLTAQGWDAFTDVQFVQRKPVWWLLNDACSREAVTRDDAFNELLARLGGGRLSEGQVRAVVARALEVQADRNRPWHPQWGDFVEMAYRAGKVPADPWRRFVGQAPQFELEATESFRRRDDAWLELVERPARVGSTQGFVLRVHRRLVITDERGGEVKRDFGPVTYHVGGASRLRGGWSLPLNDGVIGRLADGRHEARLEVVVETLTTRDARSRARDPAGDHPPVAMMRRELRTAWQVEPATAPDPGVALKNG